MTITLKNLKKANFVFFSKETCNFFGDINYDIDQSTLCLTITLCDQYSGIRQACYSIQPTTLKLSPLRSNA